MYRSHRISRHRSRAIEGRTPPLGLSAASSASSPAQASGAGNGTTDDTWKLQGSSIVGYRVDEVLFGQSHTAVGRTTSITGSLTSAGKTVTDATFTLTKPVDFGSLPAEGQQRTSQVTGTLALHGVTKTVTFEVSSERVGSTMQVAGSIPITFADWNIANPSFAGVVTTQHHGVLEFKLNFVHA
jgi:polyisoprenoid-binding protein YceI